MYFIIVGGEVVGAISYKSQSAQILHTTMYILSEEMGKLYPLAVGSIWVEQHTNSKALRRECAVNIDRFMFYYEQSDSFVQKLVFGRFTK